MFFTTVPFVSHVLNLTLSYFIFFLRNVCLGNCLHWVPWDSWGIRVCFHLMTTIVWKLLLRAQKVTVVSLVNVLKVLSTQLHSQTVIIRSWVILYSSTRYHPLIQRLIQDAFDSLLHFPLCEYSLPVALTQIVLKFFLELFTHPEAFESSLARWIDLRSVTLSIELSFQFHGRFFNLTFLVLLDQVLSYIILVKLSLELLGLRFVLRISQYLTLLLQVVNLLLMSAR